MLLKLHELVGVLVQPDKSGSGNGAVLFLTAIAVKLFVVSLRLELVLLWLRLRSIAKIRYSAAIMGNCILGFC